MLTKWELTKWELAKWEVDQMGIDKVGIDEVRIDEVGRYPSYLDDKKMLQLVLGIKMKLNKL